MADVISLEIRIPWISTDITKPDNTELTHSSQPRVFISSEILAVVKIAKAEIIWHLIRVSPLHSDSTPLGCVLLFDWLSERPICMSVCGVVGTAGGEGGAEKVQADPSSTMAMGQQPFCSRRKPGKRRWVQKGAERAGGREWDYRFNYACAFPHS